MSTPREAIRALLEDLASTEEAAGFVMIGGQAMRERGSPRLSEDVDLVPLGETGALDQRLIRRILHALTEAGHELEAIPDPRFEADSIEAGHDHLDWRWDLLVDRQIKLTFFSPELPVTGSRSPDLLLATATERELLRLKALAVATRCFHRDLFDTLHLLDAPACTMQDFAEGLRMGGRSVETVQLRLHRAELSTQDPGLELEGGAQPPGFDALRDELLELIDGWQADRAGTLLREPD